MSLIRFLQLFLGAAGDDEVRRAPESGSEGAESQRPDCVQTVLSQHR